MSENKVLFGLKNVHYAPYTVAEDNTVTYETPIAIPGAVELSLDPRGELTEFYADDMLYYAAPNNQGYDGTLSIAVIPEQFAIDALGEVLDEDDEVVHELMEATTKNFAFMFEFAGDVKATRHVMYNCTANRPSLSGSTKTDSVEVQPNELTFISSPIELNGVRIVKTKTKATTPSEIYDAWYDEVYSKKPVDPPVGFKKLEKEKEVE